MRKQIEQLMDQLADKSLTFGCRVLWKGKEQILLKHEKCLGNGFKWMFVGDPRWAHITDEMLEYDRGIRVLGHPVRIGDVLGTTYDKDRQIIRGWDDCTPDNLVDTWCACGISKSLQQIAEEDTDASEELFKLLLTLFPND